MEEKPKTPFEKPLCAECGDPLEPARVGDSPRLRLYCSKCRPAGEMKERWQPMVGSSSYRAIFVVKDSPYAKKAQ